MGYGTQKKRIHWTRMNTENRDNSKMEKPEGLPFPWAVRRGPCAASLGFTLFEVLIALAILGVVLSLLYLTFYQSMSVMAATDERAEVIQQGRMILERMTGDLKGAILLARTGGARGFRTGFIGTAAKEGTDSLDEVNFTSSPPLYSRGQEGGWGVEEIGYYLDHQPGAKGLTLFRRQDDATDGDLSKGGVSLAICDRVRSLSFEYFDRQGRRIKEWNSLEGQWRDQLPFRVEVHLKLEDPNGRAHDFRTQVFLPLAVR